MLTFITELVEALAWPVAAVTILLILKKPLSELIPLLHKLKYKDLELEFGRGVDEVKQEVQAALPPARTRTLGVRVSAALTKLADASPRAVVIDAWRQVEYALIEAAARHGVTIAQPAVPRPTELIRALEAKGLIDSAKVAIFHELRALRNTAAHGPDFAVGKESALEYGELAARLVDYLRSM